MYCNTVLYSITTCHALYSTNTTFSGLCVSWVTDMQRGHNTDSPRLVRTCSACCTQAMSQIIITWCAGGVQVVATPPVQPQSPAALLQTGVLLAPTPAPTSEGPFVQFQAVFTLIPAGYLTLPQVDEVQSSLSAAITTWVAPLPVVINSAISNPTPEAPSIAPPIAPSIAPSSGSGRRHLLQSPLTFQSTLTFLVTFTSQTVSTPNRDILPNDLSAAVSLAAAPLPVVTTTSPVLTGAFYALNASVVFPQDNTVSATPSQATLTAVTLADALTTDAAQALTGLAAKDGGINVTGVSIQDALVPAGPASTTHAPPPPPQATLLSSLNASPATTGRL